MHILTLSSLALALGILIDAKDPKPAAKPKAKSENPLPFYNWEHRTRCTQELQNPQRKDKDEWMKYQVMVVGYAWDETNGLTPDHKWNWNTTANARDMIKRYIPWAGDLIEYKFSSGERDSRGFTQFTADVEMHKTRGPIETGLNCVLGIEGMEFSMNPYESVVCIDKESAEEPARKPTPEEEPYIKVEDEIQLEKQRFEQLHKDRVTATNKALAETDRLVQENAKKLPKKTPEMEESDQRIQSIPLVIKGQSPNRVAATNDAAEGDSMVQGNADKVPKKTAEMETSDRRIQGLPPRKAGNFTA